MIDRAIEASTIPPSQPGIPNAASLQPESAMQQHNVGHRVTDSAAARSSSSSKAPKKYPVFKALTDAVNAIRNNAKTFALTIIISFVVAAVSLFLISLAAGIILVGGTGTNFNSTSKLVVVIIGALLVYTVWFALANAFVLSATSLAVYDGSDNIKSSVRRTLSVSRARFRRVAAASILYVLLAIWPVVIIIITPLVLLLTGHLGGNSSVLFVPVLILIAIAWEYIAIIRYALTPYVALFEPEIPVTKTLGRSKYLLQFGGQWFLVKGFLLLIGLCIILALITHRSLYQLTNSNSAFIDIVFILVSIIINAVLVMLYRNRKIVRAT